MKFIKTLLVMFVLGFSQETVTFHVNLNDRSNDTFKVKVFPKDLSNENNIYQFAATAPGTYQTMDIGRFVRGFKAFDEDGRQVTTTQINTNQWKIVKPESVFKITYEVLETWDTPVDSNKIYMMCGTSIEDDHVLINGQAVFGYFKGMQANPIQVKLDYPDRWKVGTALKKSGKYFNANTYDHIVDSPILLGRLSKASMSVEGTTIDIFTYSKTDLIKSKQILTSMEDMLKSASKFVYGLPVDRYTFLFHFEDYSNGAWEHSYSSEYVYKEAEWKTIEQNIKEVAAHEFFHVITPLNIHSEIIQEFNFVKPVPSQHLWLYEGTTEWASHMMLFRSGQTDINHYLEMLQRKALYNTYYGTTYSLKELALTSFSTQGQRIYGNIYMRGALVAGLLDIRLLELSDGKRGLREVVKELSESYGPNKPFKEDHFYDEFVSRTYPEINEFFNKYVKTATPLPYKEYYSKIGINYFSEKINKEEVDFGINVRPTKNGLIVRNVSSQASSFGFQRGDIITELNGEKLTIKNMRSVSNRLRSQPAGTSYVATVIRNGSKHKVDAKVVNKLEKFFFELDANASTEAKNLRNIWMKRL